MQNKPKGLLEWRNEIDSSEGMRITNKIDMLQLTYTIFKRNFEELNKLLQLYKTDENFASQLMVAENRPQFSAFLSEITRLLHNFLSSVKTLVDHTRIFCNEEYAGGDFENEYTAELKSRFDVDIVIFVQNLRNYALHQRLPVTGANYSFNFTEGVSHAVTLDIRDLKDWSGWKSKARTYLESSNENLNLQELIKEYASITESFYKWFGNRQKEIHEQDLLEVNKLQFEFHEYLHSLGYFK